MKTSSYSEKVRLVFWISFWLFIPISFISLLGEGRYNYDFYFSGSSMALVLVFHLLETSDKRRPHETTK